MAQQGAVKSREGDCLRGGAGGNLPREVFNMGYCKVTKRGVSLLSLRVRVRAYACVRVRVVCLSRAPRIPPKKIPIIEILLYPNA